MVSIVETYRTDDAERLASRNSRTVPILLLRFSSDFILYAMPLHHSLSDKSLERTTNSSHLKPLYMYAAPT